MPIKQVPYSSFLRGPSQVLPVLEEADVVLERRDAQSLVLTLADRFEARREGMAVATRMLHELISSDPVRASEILGVAVPWLHWLPEEERQACTEELVAELEAGGATGNLEPFSRALRAWMSTAEVRSDPELARRLGSALAGDGPVIERPRSV